MLKILVIVITQVLLINCHDLISICKLLKFQDVTLVKQNDVIINVIQLMKEMSKNKMRVKIITDTNDVESTDKNVIFLMNKLTSVDLETILRLNLRVRSYLIQTQEKVDWNNFNVDYSMKSLFYFNFNNLQTIIILKSKIIVENFNTTTPNLNGMHLKSIDLSWKPHIGIDNCDEFGQNCDVYGMSKDLFDILGQRLNFTVEHHLQLDNKWGSVPSQGTLLNGTYDGVYGV